MNAILGVYLHTCRLSSLVRKVLMVEVLLENFSGFFFKFSSVYLDGTGCFKHNAVAFQVLCIKSRIVVANLLFCRMVYISAWGS